MLVLVLVQFCEVDALGHKVTLADPELACWRSVLALVPQSPIPPRLTSTCSSLPPVCGCSDAAC